MSCRRRCRPAPCRARIAEDSSIAGEWLCAPTVTYKVATVNVDIVDGEKMQLVWQGVAEGRITEADLKNQQQAIDSAVGELFQPFSGTAAPAKG